MREFAQAIGVICGAFVLAYFLIVVTNMPDVQSQTPPLQHSEYDERLDRLDKQAIEQAYVAHIAQLFRTWMTDYSTNPTPFRAQKGHRNARQGYIDTMTAIEQRK